MSLSGNGRKSLALRRRLQQVCDTMDKYAYRKGSHSIYSLKVHIVWITRYRKPVLFGDVAVRLRDLIREICRSMDIDILKGRQILIPNAARGRGMKSWKDRAGFWQSWQHQQPLGQKEPAMSHSHLALEERIRIEPQVSGLL